MSLLRIEKLVAGYGAVDILNGVDLAVEPGRISVIVGPNGAGKSTAMKAIFGLAQVRDGRTGASGWVGPSSGAAVWCSPGASLLSPPPSPFSPPGAPTTRSRRSFLC